jgi:hypothetical protein
LEEILEDTHLFKIAASFVLTMGLSLASTTYTATGTASGETISAEATFDFSVAGHLTITLTNLESSQDVGQNISDLEFGLGGTTTFTGSSATTITCSKPTCTPNSTVVPTGWGFGTESGNLIVCIICGSANLSVTNSNGPNYTILGPNPDANNGSIGVSGSHNPFINQTATFTFSNTSFTTSTLPSEVMFSFGTTAGVEVDSLRQTTTPEPFSFLLVGSGLALIGLARLRRAQ